MLSLLRRVGAWTFVVGGIAFSAGFFGPMLLRPDANQGPLLGIFITGPLGLLAGFATGVVRELFGFHATPLQIAARVDWRLLFRPTAGLAALVLLMYGLAGLRRGEGRGAAAAVVIAAALAWYAAAGAMPAWFRR